MGVLKDKNLIKQYADVLRRFSFIKSHMLSNHLLECTLAFSLLHMCG